MTSKGLKELINSIRRSITELEEASSHARAASGTTCPFVAPTQLTNAENSGSATTHAVYSAAAAGRRLPTLVNDPFNHLGGLP